MTTLHLDFIVADGPRAEISSKDSVKWTLLPTVLKLDIGRVVQQLHDDKEFGIEKRVQDLNIVVRLYEQ